MVYVHSTSASSAGNVNVVFVVIATAAAVLLLELKNSHIPTIVGKIKKRKKNCWKNNSTSTSCGLLKNTSAGKFIVVEIPQIASIPRILSIK